MELGRYEDALAAHEAAIELKADVLEGWLGLATSFINSSVIKRPQMPSLARGNCSRSIPS